MISKKSIILVGILVVLILAVVVGSLLILFPKNDTSNITNNTTINTTPISDQQTHVNTSSQSNFISAAKAISIANQYLASKPGFHFKAGAASLKGSVYYVEVLEARDDAQASKGTLLGYVKVDAKTGTVLGMETWDIETNETTPWP